MVEGISDSGTQCHSSPKFKLHTQPKKERERESILETWALVEIEDWMDRKRSLLQRALVGIEHRTWVARRFGCNGLGLKLRTRWFEREFNVSTWGFG